MGKIVCSEFGIPENNYSHEYYYKFKSWDIILSSDEIEFPDYYKLQNIIEKRLDSIFVEIIPKLAPIKKAYMKARAEQ